MWLKALISELNSVAIQLQFKCNRTIADLAGLYKRAEQITYWNATKT